MGDGTVELYAFEDEDGVEETFTTFSATEAREYAQANGLLWKAHVFEYADTETVEDYRASRGEDADGEVE